MINVAQRHLSRLPSWGTLAAAIFTAGLLVRLRDHSIHADLMYLAALCLCELIALELLTRAAVGIGFRLLRLLVLVLPLGLGLVYTAQLYSIWLSGGFIPPIAFANTETAGLVSFRGAYLTLGGYTVAFVAYAAWHWRAAQPGRMRAWVLPLGLAMVAAPYALLIHDQSLSRGIVVERGESPLSSFVHSLAKYSQLGTRARLDSAQASAVRARFRRQTTYQAPFPAELVRGLPPRPNIIVVFSEGMSARWINAHGGVNPGLTPNLDRLASQSLVFNNYFNHTAATFRGLRGQLTSGHQERGGFTEAGDGVGQRDVSTEVVAGSRLSLAEILRAHGYQSVFFLSQDSFLNNMIQTLGFDRTLGREALYEAHLAGKPGVTHLPAYLSDAHLFQATLDELEAMPAEQPFFAAVYNFETHAFLDGHATYADGGNELLNRFHTFDRDMGVFLERFQSSPLHENTVLVFTSDHSTLPDPHASRADPATPMHFVDTIPLMIYWKGIQPRSVDVHGKNSLDFAPSLLSLLGLGQRVHNLFLGCTFFEECGLDRISNIGSDYYLTREDQVYTEAEIPGELRAAFEQGKEAVEGFKALDLVIDTLQ
ncbi:transmembrane sulfatase [Pseudoxanthomonas jiangsuensis]|uniref:LTA synthase family protein n=1 Tax=Pseudoxanthomonas jiangsuensis TaxID=619688 RepID=UPI0013908A0B|nr:LTA synthase family protein [Pseudoxanthomonas jiangsuensis]KAF1699341.1 transmembrane sulfatase [Pseudoxanthomonas jiangsuensis]